jgi:hypothetical protein
MQLAPLQDASKFGLPCKCVKKSWGAQVLVHRRHQHLGSLTRHHEQLLLLLLLPAAAVALHLMMQIGLANPRESPVRATFTRVTPGAKTTFA